MKKIILLDDDIDLCLLMGLTLKEFGVEDFLFVNSYDAFVSLSPEQIKADLYILDINLGVSLKNGIDAFDWLMKNYPRSNVLFFTGHAHDFPDLQKRMKIPGVRLLQKPMDLSTLEHVITEN